MVIQAGDLALEIDTGTNQPGAILQRLDDGNWIDYKVGGDLVRWPVDLRQLPPGRYRVRE